MGIEIERKFLVVDDAWRRSAGPGCRLRQGYLGRSGSMASVRVRSASGKGFLTIKGERHGLVRPEYEYEIPLDEAEEMLQTLCSNPPIEKTRYIVVHGGLLWEVDVFSASLEGLVLAEVELSDVGQHVDLPAWVGTEVTNIPEYRNVVLFERGRQSMDA